MTMTCPNCGFPYETSGCSGGCSHRWHCDCDDEEPERKTVGTTGSLEVTDSRSESVYRNDSASQSLEVTDHAVQRYQQRTNSAIPDVRLERVWELAAPVGAPHVDGTVRLYPPEDILLVAHTGAVRTVLHVGDEKLNDDHLKVCGNCGSRWDPVAHDACNWCRAARNEESTADVTKPAEARTHSTI